MIQQKTYFYSWHYLFQPHLIILALQCLSRSECRRASESVLDQQLQIPTLWLHKRDQALMHRCRCYFLNVDERDQSGRSSTQTSCPGDQSGGKHPNYNSVSFGALKRYATDPLSLARRTDNRDAFRHHHLIPTMSVEVSGAHETCLCGMCVNPTKYHQVLSIHVVEKTTFVYSFASVGRAFLLWDYQLGNKQGVRD